MRTSTNATINYSCTQDTDLAGDGNTVGTGVIHTDPLFHYVWTFSYRLEPGSPCIDTGDPVTHTSKDAFGKTRPIDGDGNGTAVTDMGYYEYLGTTTSASAPSTLGYGGKAIVSARVVTAQGGSLSAQWVAFDYSWDGKGWYNFSQSLTNQSGWAYTATYPLYSRVYLRARFLGDPSYPKSTSSVDLGQTARMGRNAQSAQVHAAHEALHRLRVPQAVTHAPARYPVRIYKWKKTSSGGGRATATSSAKVTNYSTYSKYARSIRLSSRGKWRVRAYAPADSGHAAAWSSGYDYVTVR